MAKAKAPGGKRIPSSPAGGAIFQALRDRITAHELPPGSKLLEKDLSTEFKVSRARIRDVFALLQQRGLVQRIPNRGALVETLDMPRIVQIYAVREVLEGLCGRLAAQNVPGEKWQDLIALFGKTMEREVERGNFDAYVAKLELLRARIVEGANSPILTEMIENIQDRVRIIMRRIVILPGRIETGINEHRAVLEALRRNDPEAAERTVRANIRSGLACLTQFQSFVL
jgi:DNA-binding GntR family transcriptional regulator